jgi:protein SCO1/2
MMAHRVLLGSGILALFLLAGGAWLISAEKPYTWHGVTFQSANPAPDIQLINTQGQPYQLSQQKGKIVLLLFGYTRCQDECPLTLSRLKQVKQALGALSPQVEVVFLSVDPQRDDAPTIQHFLATFDPAFIGLSGNQAELTPIWQAYGVDVQTNAGLLLDGYTVGHSTELYLIDTQGRERLSYNSEATAGDIEQDIRHLLRANLS